MKGGLYMPASALGGRLSDGKGVFKERIGVNCLGYLLISMFHDSKLI